MWYSVSDDLDIKSFGFGPADSKTSSGNGALIKYDNVMYQWTYYTSTIIIEDWQYKVLISWIEDQINKKLLIEGNSSNGREDYIFDGTYDVINNSCIDFTWISLYQSGVNQKMKPNGVTPYEGRLWSSDNAEVTEEVMHNYLFGNTSNYSNRERVKDGYYHSFYGTKNDDVIDIEE